MTVTGATPDAADHDDMDWTAEDLDTAAEHDPRCLELQEENRRRQDACALAEAWDEAHAEDQARRREAGANAAAHQTRPHD